MEVVRILGSRRMEDRVNTKNLFSSSQYTILRQILTSPLSLRKPPKTFSRYKILNLRIVCAYPNNFDSPNLHFHQSMQERKAARQARRKGEGTLFVPRSSPWGVPHSARCTMPACKQSARVNRTLLCLHLTVSLVRSHGH